MLGLVGAGHQAAFQLRAVARRRPFERVVAWNRTPEKLEGLAAVAEEVGLPFEAVSLDELGARADVIATIVSVFEPVLRDAQVSPGTHLACMGTDTRGKQEVEAALVARATVFTDEPAQAATLGECQHAVADGSLARDAIIPIGAVIEGAHLGRTFDDEVTLSDGTGVGLQDLAVALAVARLAVERGVAVEVEV